MGICSELDLCLGELLNVVIGAGRPRPRLRASCSSCSSSTITPATTSHHHPRHHVGGLDGEWVEEAHQVARAYRLAISGIVTPRCPG